MTKLEQATTNELLEELEKRSISQNRVFIYVLGEDEQDAVSYSYMGKEQEVLGHLRFFQEQLLMNMMAKLTKDEGPEEVGV